MNINQIVDLTDIRKQLNSHSKDFYDLLEEETDREVLIKAFFREVMLNLKSYNRMIGAKVPSLLLELVGEANLKNSPVKLKTRDIDSIRDNLEGYQYGEFYKEYVRGVKSQMDKANNLASHLYTQLEKLIK